MFVNFERIEQDSAAGGAGGGLSKAGSKNLSGSGLVRRYVLRLFALNLP